MKQPQRQVIMQHEFWRNAWAKDKQGWHQATANIHLQKYWEQFVNDMTSEKVFVPMCGQSIDMLWLNDNGHSVVGVELDQGSIERFFDKHQISHSRTSLGSLLTFGSDRLAIHTGDFFELTTSHLYGAQLVYDRASLIALPKHMRQDYANKLRQLLIEKSKILLITITYDEKEMSGPPFSVSDEEVFQLFENGFEVKKIASSSDPGLLGGLVKRGLSALTESVFFLEKIA